MNDWRLAMSTLSATLIDVGWGDSILIESVTEAGERHYALVDCNDTELSRSSYLFVKRFLERRKVDLDGERRVFDFVLLTHGHADHANGIQAMMKNFRTDWFWYPKSIEYGGFAKIIRYANRYTSKVNRHQAIDRTKVLPNLGDALLNVLWPPYTEAGPFDANNENNNSIVLALTVGQVSFLLTGDCEAHNWHQIVANLPQIPGLAMFQVPHHGAVNGVFDTQGNAPWLDALSGDVRLAMSSHVRPYNHPAPQVIQELQNRNIAPFRTDQHYHLTFTTDGTVDMHGVPKVKPRWSHA
jgi:beta-lactamase superfamily II metal-dependent hydrolase